MPSRISIPGLTLLPLSSPSPVTKMMSPLQPLSSRGGNTNSGSTPGLAPASSSAQLHVDNISASSDQPHIIPVPPQRPGPWVWQCHHCKIVYSLGTTRTCLDCSHTYCIPGTGPKKLGSSKNRSKRNKQHRVQVHCRTKFDYSGWMQWNIWRRKMLDIKALRQEDDPRAARDRVSLKKKSHDCSIDCNFPWECRDRRRLDELNAEALRRQQRLPKSSTSKK